jgi:hypothetical protein
MPIASKNSCIKMHVQNSFDFVYDKPLVAPRLALAFCSGMSRSKDFWAAAATGAAIGVVALELSSSSVLLGLPRFLAARGSVFIDSGAFAEIKTGICPDFGRVLGIYEAIAEATEFRDGSLDQLYVVAPDKVGDQMETLARLKQYSDRVVDLIHRGCKVIVPLQRGVIPAADMLARAIAILGTTDFVVGIPSNKEALSFAECASLDHHSFHILGRVQMNKDQIERMEALTTKNPDAILTADANWLRSRMALVSKLSGDERNVRRLMSSRAAEHASLVSSCRASAITAALKLETVWGRLAA